MIQLILVLLLTIVDAESSFTCKTTYDQINIPHVETSSIDELYYCFGLHHGKDRAWEMDYFRRVAEGRNSEVLGFKHLKSDLMMRLLDLPSEAEKIWNIFPPEQKRLLEFYTRGVNKGLESGKDSVEFKDSGYIPDPWKAQHSIIILLLQSFDQTRKTFFRDYEEELLKEKWGKKTALLFDEDHTPWSNTILKEGEYQKRDKSQKTTFNQHTSVKLWGDFPHLFGQESGSNNWVVSKSKSKSGKAILANDPHLDLKTPIFWYWISLSSPIGKVTGASVPGFPFVASGTNGKVAWGLTNSYLNSADVVFIKDLKENQIETFRPLVFIKWWIFKIPFFFKSFEKLKSGDRILPLELSGDNKLVLRWTGLRLSPQEITPMFDLIKVSNVTEADNLLSKVGVPSWNFVFADQNGDIGYRLVGKTFRHTEKLPLGISTMSLSEFYQENYLSSSERPSILKPSRHYVYSANNRHWPEDSKYYGGRGYGHSYRGFRIDELLKKNTQSVDSFKKIQCDRQVVDARFFLPKIQKILNLSEFKNWSMLAHDHSKELPLYRRMMDLMMEKWHVNEYALFKLLDALDPSQIRRAREIYHQALTEIQDRHWGDFHRVNFSHLSKNNDWIFSPDIPGIGDTHSVDPGTSKWNAQRGVYEQHSGASMRMIIEMDETPRIWLALPGVNRNYDKKVNPEVWMKWKNCQYSEVSF